MNTLDYLSRLASPRPLPSSSSIKRVNTWSAKSLLFPPPHTPKRSFSSPPDFISFVSHSNSISQQVPTIRPFFAIRLFLLLSHLLSAAWASVAARQRPPNHDLSSLYFPDPDSQPPTNTHPDTTTPPSLATATAPVTDSRTPTPVSARKSPFPLLPKTLVLDLDETLIHSTSRPMPSFPSAGSGLLGLSTLGRRNKGVGHTVEVVMGGRSTLYHVYKRPFVDFFLRTVSGWYTLVIFTASMQEYADPVIDWLDAGRGILARRFFRDSCTLLPNGSYTKNLSVVEPDLSRVCLVDNSPISYRHNEANGIPIEGWTHDPSDEALLDLLPFLDSLRFTNDVRRVLGLRGFSSSIDRL